MDLPSALLGFAIDAARGVIAVAVTVHVLLRKRDVRGALGWIGVAWLSPILGGLLYSMFGINRVTRRALRLDEGDQAAQTITRPAVGPAVSASIADLAEIGLNVTGQHLAAGTRVEILCNGDAAYPAMLAAIAQARHSIALASYIFRHDAAGRDFVEALLAAHRRGVAVRVLIDGVGGGYILPAVLRRLQAGGIPTARFLHTWVPWRMPFLNMRNHKKLLIVDGTLGFTGGVNIGAENLRLLSPRTHIEDVHAKVEGPVVRQLMDTFARDWSFTTDETLNQDIWWPAIDPAGPVFARGIRSGPDADIDKLETIVGAALAQAQHRVRIVTPYFLPDQRIQFAIAQAGLRGVTVDIVIPERSDLVFIDWAARAHLRFWGSPSADVYISALPFDHSKIMTVDGEFCLIGSSNWDTRSFRLNFEFDLECYDADLVAELDALIDQKIGRSQRLSQQALLSAPRWMQLRDAAFRLLLPYL